MQPISTSKIAKVLSICGWHHSVFFDMVTLRNTIDSLVSGCFASHGQACPLLRTMVLHVLPALFALERALPAAQIRFS